MPPHWVVEHLGKIKNLGENNNEDIMEYIGVEMTESVLKTSWDIRGEETIVIKS